MSTARTIVGIAGEIGAGKDTLATLLKKELEGSLINISDVVRRQANQDGVPPDRGSISRYSAATLLAKGNDYFANIVISECRQRTGTVIVPSVRTLGNVTAFRQAFGSEFILLAIVISNRELRWQRISTRSGPHDTARTRAEFECDDSTQEELFGLSEVITSADELVDNGGTKDVLVEWVQDFGRRLRRNPRVA